MDNLDEILNEVLYRAREEYEALSDQDILKIIGDERTLYFKRYTMFKELIISVESFLKHQSMLKQL